MSKNFWFNKEIRFNFDSTWQPWQITSVQALALSSFYSLRKIFHHLIALRSKSMFSMSNTLLNSIWSLEAIPTAESLRNPRSRSSQNRMKTTRNVTLLLRGSSISITFPYILPLLLLLPPPPPPPLLRCRGSYSEGGSALPATRACLFSRPATTVVWRLARLLLLPAASTSRGPPPTLLLTTYDGTCPDFPAAARPSSRCNVLEAAHRARAVHVVMWFIRVCREGTQLNNVLLYTVYTYFTSFIQLFIYIVYRLLCRMSIQWNLHITFTLGQAWSVR